MIVTVTPNPALDRTLRVDRLELGGVNRARARTIEPSGKGVNITRALTVNRTRSIAILPVGGPDGMHLCKLLDHEGVPHVEVPINGSVRVNVAVLGPSGEVTKINEPGPELTSDEAAELERAVVAQATDAAWLVGAGALPPGVPTDYYARLCLRAHEAGARFAVDGSGAALQVALAAGPDVVKPNLDELAELTGRRLDALGDVLEAADDVRQQTGGRVLVSLGAHGALLVADEGALHGRAAVPHVRNPTGGGDSLLAGFLAAYRAGPEQALREGLAWAAAAIQSTGSLGAAVTTADRARVRVRSEPDRGYLLG